MFFVANLRLVGQVPDELKVLTSLEDFDISINKKITGTFPSFTKELPQLKYIGLHYCGFSGSLPTWLGEIKSLDTLMLSNNEFDGPLPVSMRQLAQLGK